MSAPEQPLASRLQQLLEVVDQDREKRCAGLIDQAYAESNRIVRQAWQKTRARLHHEAQQSREAFRRQLLLEQARNAARRRLARESADRAWLDQAWPLLQEALTRRWQMAEGRALWVDVLTRQAQSRLVRRDWQIEHPSNWPQAEQQTLKARLQATLGETPVFVADPALPAGIRVRTGDTVVDGSHEGLLRDRTHIEALLLAFARTSRHG